MTTLIVQEDPHTGDLFLELPSELLEAVGLVEGDNIQWIVNDDGTCSFSRAE
tara:strand:+ start:778 stop:933 length:156 start_codon:yes stop_codon:yes gene_type:complete